MTQVSRLGIMYQILQTIGADGQSRPTAIEFEMAYQAGVSIDRIRFAIKHTEQFGPRTDQMREAGLQLLDALHRLEAVDHRFHERSRICSGARHASRALTRDGQRSTTEVLA